MSLRDKILTEFQKLKYLTSSQLAGKFKVTRQGLNRHLKLLIQQGRILKLGTSRKTTFYVLNQPAAIRKAFRTEVPSFKKRYPSHGLEEDLVFQEVTQHPHLLRALSSNARRVFQYAFTEMLNNAIDHSQSDRIDVVVQAYPVYTAFFVRDHGIGVFENIRLQKALTSELEALQDLLKGKQTTQPQFHSGEGIFFTSRVVDTLILESHRKRITFNNDLPDVFVEDIALLKGTAVTALVSNETRRELETVFREHTNEEFQFQKSGIQVKLFRGTDSYMSRSQAKRLLHALNQFQEVVLDFKGVDTIGQGFADEVFRVFPLHHPGIRLVPIHANENVQLMIDHTRQGVVAERAAGTRSRNQVG